MENRQKKKIQSTPDNSNLQGKSKKGSSYREFEENNREYGKKNSFYCTVNILITFKIVEMSSENEKILLDYKSERNVTKIA